MGPAWAQHGTPDATPCGGLARISKQLPLDAGATALAGRWLGEWSPGAPGTFVGNGNGVGFSTENQLKSHTVVDGLDSPLRID